MGKSVGRALPVTPYRRLVTELMYASAKVPSVSADRRMDLRPLAAARQICSPRPSWCGLFAKAFGMVSRDHPELRRSYMKFPRPWIYEHPHSVVSLNVDRETAQETHRSLLPGPGPRKSRRRGDRGDHPPSQGRTAREPALLQAFRPHGEPSLADSAARRPGLAQLHRPTSLPQLRHLRDFVGRRSRGRAPEHHADPDDVDPFRNVR